MYDNPMMAQQTMDLLGLHGLAAGVGGEGLGKMELAWTILAMLARVAGMVPGGLAILVSASLTTPTVNTQCHATKRSAQCMRRRAAWTGHNAVAALLVAALLTSGSHVRPTRVMGTHVF
jgi:hypothetical protein